MTVLKADAEVLPATPLCDPGGQWCHQGLGKRQLQRMLLSYLKYLENRAYGRVAIVLICNTWDNIHTSEMPILVHKGALHTFCKVCALKFVSKGFD